MCRHNLLHFARKANLNSQFTIVLITLSTSLSLCTNACGKACVMFAFVCEQKKYTTKIRCNVFGVSTAAFSNHTHSLTHSLTLTFTHTLMHTDSHIHSLPHTHSHIHLRSHSLTHTFTHTHIHSPTQTQSHLLTFTPHTHTHSHSLHTHTHTLMLVMPMVAQGGSVDCLEKRRKMLFSSMCKQDSFVVLLI